MATQGMFAPARTSAAIIAQLNREIVRALNQPDAREKFLNQGVEPIGSTAEEFAAFVRADMAKMDKLIKAAGIQKQ